jgi:hypothetical protein
LQAHIVAWVYLERHLQRQIALSTFMGSSKWRLQWVKSPAIVLLGIGMTISQRMSINCALS